MKNLLYIALFGTLVLGACDKVENPYPPGVSSGELDWSLYPDGDSTHYVDVANAWPTFTANTNTNRNVLIEDFTGHRCIFCPNAAAVAEQLEDNNPGRVFVSSVHTGPTGQMEGNQVVVVSEGYIEDFTTQEGFDIGFKFGQGWAGSPFLGNPYGTISRKDNGNGFPVTPPASWANATNAIIAANELKVNIQAATNYYPSTRGIFLHTEVDVIDPTLTNELRIVVQLMEDTLVGPQKLPDNSTDYDYVHHDIFRGTIDGRTFGRILDADHMGTNGKYYFDYTYALPNDYDWTNVHLLIYVRDAVTEEVYQVIEKHL